MSGRPTEDLTGREFERWKVLYALGYDVLPNGKRKAIWACVCACSPEAPPSKVRAQTLLAGRSTSCGCRRKENQATSITATLEDLTGKVFAGGAITVLRLKGARNGRRVWECRCHSCESIFDAATSKLVAGERSGCGCGIARRKNHAAAMKAIAKRYQYGGSSLTAVELASLSGVFIRTLKSRLMRGYTAEEAVWGKGGQGLQASDMQTVAENARTRSANGCDPKHPSTSRAAALPPAIIAPSGTSIRKGTGDEGVLARSAPVMPRPTQASLGLTSLGDIDLIGIAQTTGIRAQAAMRTLLDRYDRLIHKVAWNWRRRGVSPSDLEQEARIGMMQAITAWRKDRGASLMTFGHLTATRRVICFLDDSATTVRLPRYVRQAIRVARRLGTDDLSKINDSLEQPVPEDATDLLKGFRMISTETPLGQDGEGTLGDTLEGGSRPDDLAEVADDHDDARATLEAALATMRPREADVIRRKHMATNPERGSEIAVTLGLSRARIGQIEEQAMRNLKIALERQRIRGGSIRSESNGSGKYACSRCGDIGHNVRRCMTPPTEALP